MVKINLFQWRIAIAAGIPFVFAAVLFGVARIALTATVIVDNHTVDLPIAFARCVDKRSGIFEHRHEERNNE